MIRIGIGLSLVVLAGFAATAAVDRRGELAGPAVIGHVADPASGSLPLPAWHPPVLRDDHAMALPPGHPPILPQGHPPLAGDVLTCPGGGMLPGRVPGSDGGRSAETPTIISI